jgi:hypothetical protein
MQESWHVRYAISGQSVHTATQAELLHYFCVQEHEENTKDQAMKKNVKRHKDACDQASCHAQHHGHF